ncbi:MAG TPA: FG-GAP-like repeat-containing protein [Bacteroidota bacterium]|nr:FG-GAP-like repeat-containing protein [Bacteroidota bacterium]
MPAQFPVWNKDFNGLGISVGINPYNGNTAYSQGNDLGLYVTRNGGASWSLVNASIPYETREIIVHPNDTSTIFVVNFSDGLYRSTNGGATFTLVLNNYGIDGESVVYDPVHPDTMYAGNFGDASVFRSVDRGQTWTFMGHAGTTGNLCSLVVRPDSANILYAGTGAGTISKSIDTGKTWKQVKSGGSQEVPKMVIDPRNPLVAYATAYAGNPAATGIWKSIDGGETWNLTSLHNISMWSMDIDLVHPDTIYAGTFSEYSTAVYRTSDAGATWAALPQGFSPYNSLWNLKVDRQGATKLYMAATHGDFNPDGVYILTPATAEISGFVIDSLNSQVITSGTVQISPSGEQYDLSVTNGAYHVYRFAGDTSTTRTLSVTINSSLFYQQTRAFISDSNLSLNLLVQPGSITGTVYDDLNGNGVRDGGEPPLAGWVVQLSGPSVLSTVTDNNGNYSFTNLFPGTYTVHEQTNFGYSVTEPPGGSYSAAVSFGSKDFTGRDFGNRVKHHVVAVSPAPFMNNVPPAGTMQVTFDTAMNPATFLDTNTVFLRGSVSGYHHAGIAFGGGGTILTITPGTPFAPGEVVTVDISRNVLTAGNTPMTPWSWQFTVAAGRSEGTFAPRVDYGTGNQPWAVALGDVDNDGHIDIVTANANSNSISVLRNNGDGTFAGKVDFPTGSTPRGISLADINNDGYLDVIVADNGASTVTVLLNDHAGGFSSRTDYPAGGPPSTIAVGNLSGSGAIDVVGLLSTHNAASVMLNTGGTLGTPVPYSAGAFPWAGQIADLNGDGGNDLAVINSNGTPSAVGILQNTGGGALALPVSYPLGALSRGVGITDLNNDGRPDLLSTNSTDNNWTFYLQAGDGSYSSRTDIPTGTLPWFLATGDLDGDGQIDVCTVNASSNSLSVYRNLTGTTFARTDYPTGNGPHGVAIADLNGDGNLDIVVVNSSDNTVSVFLNALSLPIVSGWNMLSVPTIEPQMTRSALFPSAVSNAFAYLNGYVATDTLRSGTGYWVKFDTAGLVTYVGRLLLGDTIALAAGWNLIGAPGDTVPVGSLQTIPSGLIESNFFSYGGSYQIASDLVPGQAYWVRSTGAGFLILGSSNSRAKSVRPDPKNSFATFSLLSVADARGHRQELYFSSGRGTAPNAVMPPAPPEGAFDCRLGADRLAVSGPGSWPIHIAGVVYPLTISWKLSPSDAGIWSLSTAGGGKILGHDGSVAVASPAEAASLVLRPVAGGSAVPRDFELSQNYPNPFNPSTTIAYSLPFRSRVTLTVTNLLGETVQEIVNGDQDAGSYTRSFLMNSASGVYYYRLRAFALDGSGKVFDDIRKMVLMK